MVRPPALGERPPMFIADSTSRQDYHFDTAAGRYVVMCLFGSAGREPAQMALAAVRARRALFDDERACLFGISTDPADRNQARVGADLPGIRMIWDFDQAVSHAYGAFSAFQPGRPLVHRPYWLVLDPQMRTLLVAPLAAAQAVLDFVAALPPVEAHAGVAQNAPVLITPRVFEPEFCRRLIALFDAGEKSDSGFMITADGKSVSRRDHDFKRRTDVMIEDAQTCAAIQAAIRRRLVPEIARAFQFTATRMERYLVARYDAEPGGYFGAHRDNTTASTAHRRFAVTINLNAEDYQGGDLCFPEFGSRHYRAPTGGAVVFSCSLLHKVEPMRSGSRYSFLPFLYDEDAARIREGNNVHLGEGVEPYSADLAASQTKNQAI